MAARSIAYHARSWNSRRWQILLLSMACVPWHKSAVHCLLRLAPTMIIIWLVHMNAIKVGVYKTLDLTLPSTATDLKTRALRCLDKTKTKLMRKSLFTNGQKQGRSMNGVYNLVRPTSLPLPSFCLYTLSHGTCTWQKKLEEVKKKSKQS